MRRAKALIHKLLGGDPLPPGNYITKYQSEPRGVTILGVQQTTKRDGETPKTESPGQRGIQGEKVVHRYFAEGESFTIELKSGERWTYTPAPEEPQVRGDVKRYGEDWHLGDVVEYDAIPECVFRLGN